MKSVFKGNLHKKTDKRDADLILLILASQSIESRLDTEKDGNCNILVPEQSFSKASAHIRQYAKENQTILKKITHLPATTFFSPTALVAGLILILIHYICISKGIHRQAVFQFGVSSYFLSQGESYRAITALFLHSDTAHLLGNIGGILALVGPLIRLTGYGSGLFLILCAGTTGNLISDGLGHDARISIGASTAIMASAGLLAARQMVLGTTYRFSLFSKLKGIAPFAAAATLMAMFSHGENTDVSAHFFGFLSGVGIGIIYFPASVVIFGAAVERFFLAFVLLILSGTLLQSF